MKYSPIVFRNSLLGKKVVMFYGPVGNKFRFSNHKLITTRKPPSMEKALLFQSSPPKAERRGMRSFVLEFLRPDALQRNIHIMDSMARQNINMDWALHKEVNVYPLSKKYTFTLDCHLFISIKDPNTCGNSPRGLPWSLDHNSHIKLASPSYNTTISRGSDRPRSPRLCQQAVG